MATKIKVWQIIPLAAALILCGCRERVPGSAAAESSDTARESETEEIEMYYVRTAADSSALQLGGPFPDLAEASEAAALNKVYGYRVFDREGRTVSSPYPELACEILAKAKEIADFVRTSGYSYGDAGINPAIDRGQTEKIISCDRFVGWVMYDLGFTDQPKAHGLTLYRTDGYALPEWCEKMGFEKITSRSELQAGDIVFVRPEKHPLTGESGYPAHVFIYAGESEKKNQFYRYDCGSDKRITSVQPFCEPIDQFVYAYRPVRTEK